jgi:3-isopropylmalate dehydrogenase
MKFSIAVLPGDGAGHDVVPEGLKVLESIQKVAGHEFRLRHASIGAGAWETTGEALSDATIELCRSSDAVLFGAVGDPRYERPDLESRPENGYGFIRLRQALGLFANLRPVKLFPGLENYSNLKPEVVRGLDLIIVRELIGGIYFAEPKYYRRTPAGSEAVDTLYYSEQEVERIVRVGFELARGRRKKLLEVDKFGILRSSDLWRSVSQKLAAEYPGVKLEHMNVDACAMQLIRKPTDLDVIVTENLFGDILSDEASMLAGSIGMMPSASLAGVPLENSRSFGLYEPIHGSAPEIAGQDVANPIATILSAAMMLRYSLGLEQEAIIVEQAVEAVLDEGYRTVDILSRGMKKVGTREMGDLIAARILESTS